MGTLASAAKFFGKFRQDPRWFSRFSHGKTGVEGRGEHRLWLLVSSELDWGRASSKPSRSLPVGAIERKQTAHALPLPRTTSFCCKRPPRARAPRRLFR